MSQFRKEALGETLGEYKEVVACVEVLITTKSWWDTVDMLASHSEQLTIWLHNSCSYIVYNLSAS